MPSPFERYIEPPTAIVTRPGRRQIRFTHSSGSKSLPNQQQGLAPQPDKCHVEVRYSEIVIAGVDTGKNHTLLEFVDDTSGFVQIIDGQPVFSESANALLLTPSVTTNGIYNNANSATPYVSTRSNQGTAANGTFRSRRPGIIAFLF